MPQARQDLRLLTAACATQLAPWPPGCHPQDPAHLPAPRPLEHVITRYRGHVEAVEQDLLFDRPGRPLTSPRASSSDRPHFHMATGPAHPWRRATWGHVCAAAGTPPAATMVASAAVPNSSRPALPATQKENGKAVPTVPWRRPSTPAATPLPSHGPTPCFRRSPFDRQPRHVPPSPIFSLVCSLHPPYFFSGPFFD